MAELDEAQKTAEAYLDERFPPDFAYLERLEAFLDSLEGERQAE